VDVPEVRYARSGDACESGGLVGYGPDYRAIAGRAASYVDKILKGAKLVINLKTAKALGLTIPPSLLGRADEVIQ
jgi:putative ABC transport system substrate-binding protein